MILVVVPPRQTRYSTRLPPPRPYFVLNPLVVLSWFSGYSLVVRVYPNHARPPTRQQGTPTLACRRRVKGVASADRSQSREPGLRTRDSLCHRPPTIVLASTPACEQAGGVVPPRLRRNGSVTYAHESPAETAETSPVNPVEIDRASPDGTARRLFPNGAEGARALDSSGSRQDRTELSPGISTRPLANHGLCTLRCPPRHSLLKTSRGILAPR